MKMTCSRNQYQGMRISILTLLMVLTASHAFAQDTRLEPGVKSASLSGIPKVIIQRAVLQTSKPLDFSSFNTHAQLSSMESVDLTVRRDAKTPPNACGHGTSSLCYDYRTGSAIYKPMAGLLPAIPGLTPRNLTIRRNAIVASYTFK